MNATSVHNKPSAKGERLVIVGASPIAEVAYEYFTYDSPYRVVAFSVSAEFIDRSNLFGLPVVALEELTTTYSPDDCRIFVAVGYGEMNRVRARLVEQVKSLGYRLVSYISSEAFVWRNVTVGENCFILEHNVIQPFVTIEHDVTLWSGNHIGHHSRIAEHCFVSSHVVVSGFVEVGANSFLGVNSTVANNVTIGRDNLIGAGATILKDTQSGEIYAADRTKSRERSVYAHFGIAE